MDMLKVLQWIILIFVFYIFIFYLFFRIIYRKLKERNRDSRVEMQSSDESKVKIEKPDEIILKSKNML